MSSMLLTSLRRPSPPSQAIASATPSRRFTRTVRFLSQSGRMAHSDTRTDRLFRWTSGLKYDDLPAEVIDRTKAFFLDWLGCAIAGRSHPAVTAIAKFATQMGPSKGRSHLVDGSLGFTTSPAFASLINGASSHVVEQDDLHNSSITHPATVIFPTALAVAQDVGASGEEFITACVVGYEAGCRTGEYLGKAHYEKFHTTATAGVIGAAAATAHLLKLNFEQTLSAVGTAGTQAAGLWQFLIDATHSKQVHPGKAGFDGIFAAYSARDGLLGPRDILEGPRAMGKALTPGDNLPEAIDRDLGSSFAILRSSFKWHASCRHTHPSVDALLSLMEKNDVTFQDVESIIARTYQAAFDVLGLSGCGETIHQSKFNMGFVLAVAARNGQARIEDFTEEALNDVSLRDFQNRVTMKLDADIDRAFPEQWRGTVVVTTKSGLTFTESVSFAKGDPERTLTLAEIDSKVRGLAQYGRVTDQQTIESLIELAHDLEKQTNVNGFTFAS